MPVHLAYLSLALYAASFICYARILYAPNLWLGRLATLLLAAAIGVHYLALLGRTQSAHTIPYDDLYGSMSLFAWLLGITYLGLELLHRQRSVGACVTLFMVIWLAALEALAPKPPIVAPPAEPPEPAGGPHEAWMDIGGRQRFRYRFRQSVEAFIAGHHARPLTAFRGFRPNSQRLERGEASDPGAQDP